MKKLGQKLNLASSRIFILSGILALVVYLMTSWNSKLDVYGIQFFASFIIAIGLIGVGISFYWKWIKRFLYEFTIFMFLLGIVFFVWNLISSIPDPRMVTSFLIYSVITPWYFRKKIHLIAYSLLLISTGLGLQLLNQLEPIFLFIYTAEILLTSYFVIIRIRSIEKLVNQKRSFEKIINRLETGIIQLDPFGFIIETDKNIHALTGYSSKELIGKSYINFLCREQERSHIHQLLDNAKRNLRFFESEQSWKRKNKSQIWISVKCIPELSGSGNLQGFVLFAEDQTAQKLSKENGNVLTIEYRERLNHLNRLHEELAHMAKIASEDLQVPLIELEQLLAEKNAQSFTSQQTLDKIQQKSQQIVNLVDALIIPSQSHSHNNYEMISLEELLEEVNHSLKLQIAAHNVQISSLGLPHIFGDKLQILRLFRILIEYAIESSPGQSDLHIQISAMRESDNKNCLLMVSDNGKGIDQQQYDELMQVLKLANDDKKQGRQHGIGACKQIVKHHGGKFWIKSTRGSGNTFYFTMPLYKEELSKA